jgi:hypothetical protein
MRPALLTLVWMLITASPTFAQSFSGSYSGKEGVRTHSLKLQQEANGSVTGTYSDGEATLQLSGEVKDGAVVGKGRLQGVPITFSFKVRRESGGIVLELTEEENGTPDPETTEKVSLKPDGGAPTADKPADKPADSPADKPAKPNPRDKRTPSDPFVGKFVAKDLTVELLTGVGGYEGTLTKDGAAYPLKAKRSGPGIEGSFKAGDDSFEFLAKVEAGVLQLKSGDTVYLLNREGGATKANPLEKSKPKNPLAAGASATKAAGTTGNDERAPGPAWKIFKHPAGISVRYPKDWDTRAIPSGGTQLLPPGATAESKEIYLLNGQAAEGIMSVDDPRLAQAVDALVAQAVPALRRTKPGEPVKAEQQPGMLFVYEGGNNGAARLYVTIINGYALAVVGLGDKTQVNARDGVLRQIFSSLGWKEGERDAALVGAWKKVGTTSLDSRDAVGRLQASSVSESQRSMVLRPDGTCTSREVSRTIALGQGVSLDSGDQVTTQNGKWFAGNGKLVLIWEKGADEYTYSFRGGAGSREVVIGTGGSRGEIWAR